jgi:hypothetical protein
MLKILMDARFEKHLAALRKAGKKGEIAAEKVVEVAKSLYTEGKLYLHGRILTKKGEARIPGCVKFDLGSGYRLVCLLEEDRLYILFVGTHDESDRWIENNKEIRARQIAERCRPILSMEGDIPKNGSTMENEIHEQTDDPGEELCDELFMDDRILKAIFSGLLTCRAPKSEISCDPCD